MFEETRWVYKIFTYQNKLNLEWVEDFLKVEGEGSTTTSTSSCPLRYVMAVGFGFVIVHMPVVQCPNRTPMFLIYMDTVLDIGG